MLTVGTLSNEEKQQVTVAGCGDGHSPAPGRKQSAASCCWRGGSLQVHWPLVCARVLLPVLLADGLSPPVSPWYGRGSDRLHQAVLLRNIKGEVLDT